MDSISPNSPRRVFSSNKTLGSAFKRRRVALLLILIAAFVASSLLLGRPPSSSALTNNGSITSFGSPLTENFDTLATTGTSNTWTDNVTIPGWYSTRTTYSAGTGSSNTGALYSFGSTSSSDRALGSVASGTTNTIFFAVKLTNNTGGTINSLDISYVGEQWRDGGNATPVAQSITFQYQVANSGTITGANAPTTGWTPFAALDFTSPTFTTTAAALNGNLAANRTAKMANLAVTVNNGQEIWLRWQDINDAGNDHGLAVDDLSITANGGAANAPVVPTCPSTIATVSGTPASAPISASDADGTVTGATITSITPSNPGTITLSGFTPAGGTGGTATATLNVGAATPAGSYNVTVRWSNNDATPQTADCVIAVTVTAPATLTPIHDIQGSGNTSPLTGSTVSTRGIVTGVKSNGFFIQEPDASIDANPATSEGVFVFTSAAPPGAAVVGNLVQVTGNVQEFIPSADPVSPPTTEIGSSPTVTLVSMGNPLPAPQVLAVGDTSPSGAIEQLEKFEGMRVQVNSMTVIAPTQGNVSEANATSTSTGVFYGVITGIARPFREPGIQIPDPLPLGSPCCVPRFDGNPERLRVDSDGLVGGAKIEVTAGATITGLVGPLDFAFRTYTIDPDPLPAPQPVVTGNLSAIPVPVAAPNEFTVGSFNMERFFDTTNDPGVDDVALTATAFNNRLNKASLAIRNVMLLPDVIGVEEMENLTTLQAVATKVNNDEVAATHPNPNYQAYLVEGNDIGGIDVGFLVKSTRVVVIDVTQVGKDTTYINPNNGMPELLNDRPSLVMRAIFSPPGGGSAAVTVIVNHLRSLSGVDDPADGNRVRTKRRAQAEFLANLIQARQTADPNERIISIGDYNAFQFNDGYVDGIGTVKGTPTAASEVVLASGDLVNPDLIDLIDSVPADQRYSFSFDGNAQALDHELVNPKMFELFTRIAYARNDSDFPETFRSDPNRPERISDHDMAVAYFTPPCMITCPANITVGNQATQCGATVSFSTTNTNCPGVVCTPASGSFFPVGTTTVTCAESAPASSASCSFTVTVNDTQAPAITCPANITVSADSGVCSAVVSFSVGSTDNCPGAVVVSNPPSGSTFPKGTTTVSSTATDLAGNSSSCSFTVTVNDTQPPSITCPANIVTGTATGQCNKAVTFAAPVVSDNCSGVGTPTCSPASGSTFAKGTTTVTCSVTDGSGNSASCSFTVTVNDTQPPSIACPANITAITPGATDTCATVNYAPVATDNCPGVAVACTPPSGTCFPTGITTVMCVATDTSGNTAACSFTVTVFDACVQDDGDSSRVALVNSMTGDYRFCCGGTTYTGRGTVTSRAGVVTLEHNGSGRRVTIRVDKVLKLGTASLQAPPGTVVCTIRDTNTANNQCACQ